MRARIARGLVRWVSRWWTAAYQANVDGHKRMESFFAAGARCAGAVALPVAGRLDYGATGQQMVEECWWG